MDVTISDVTAADRAVARSTKRLIPFLLLMYVLAFLDRANVGFAKQGLHDVVGISDAAFAFGASIFFIAYVLLETRATSRCIKWAPVPGCAASW